jgi:hypothetical protein
MKTFLNTTEAITDLHRQGFTNDFQLFGNDLLWVQGKIFIRAGEFSILEYFKITDVKNNMNESVVFGIIAPYHNIKGILPDHYKSYTDATPPVLVKKLNESGIKIKL